MIADSSQRMELFRNMLWGIHKIDFWKFDADKHLLEFYSDAPNEMLYFFSFEEDQITHLSSHTQCPVAPIILTNQLSMVWLVDFEPDESKKTTYMYLAGPVFIESERIQSIKRSLYRRTLSDGTIADFTNIIDHIPLVPLTHLLEYGIMMHYCITGQHISVSDYIYIMPKDTDDELDKKPINQTIHQSWIAEQNMLKQIEEGNLQYKKYINELSSVASAVNIGDGTALRQCKNMAIIYTTLCSRSAIRGGLDPDIAYSLSDRYINSIEDSKSVSDVADINAVMQEDYVRRVHNCKTHPEISPQIQKCCTYIQMHLSEPLSAALLSKYTGYSESYLSKKFKHEIGTTIKEYILTCKIETAKEMLRTSTVQIQDLCDQLGFNSQSYFGSQFKKITGMTPSEYRTQNEN